MDAIVTGCDWAIVVSVAPSDGRTNGDVVADLTDATATAFLRNPRNATVTSITSAIDAGTRRITLSLTSLQTARLAIGSCTIALKVNADDGRVMFVSIPETVTVQAF